MTLPDLDNAIKACNAVPYRSADTERCKLLHSELQQLEAAMHKYSPQLLEAAVVKAVSIQMSDNATLDRARKMLAGINACLAAATSALDSIAAVQAHDREGSTDEHL